MSHRLAFPSFGQPLCFAYYLKRPRATISSRGVLIKLFYTSSSFSMYHLRLPSPPSTIPTNSPQAYIPLPSMLPRPLLTRTFALAYRKIPVLALGREIYCDTSLIIEALEHFFPASQGWGSIYPKFEGIDEWTYKGLVRGFASFWTDVSSRVWWDEEGGIGIGGWANGNAEAALQNNNRPDTKLSLVLPFRHRPRTTHRTSTRPLQTSRQNPPEPCEPGLTPLPPGTHVQESRHMGHSDCHAIAR